MDYCGTGIGVTKCSCPGEFSDAQYAAENYSPAGAWTLRDGTLEPSRSDWNKSHEVFMPGRIFRCAICS